MDLRGGGACVGWGDAQRETGRLGRQERQAPAVRRPIEIERRSVGAVVEDHRIGRCAAVRRWREDVDRDVGGGRADDRDPRSVGRPGREGELRVGPADRGHPAPCRVHRQEVVIGVDHGQPRDGRGREGRGRSRNRVRLGGDDAATRDERQEDHRDDKGEDDRDLDDPAPATRWQGRSASGPGSSTGSLTCQRYGTSPTPAVDVPM